MLSVLVLVVEIDFFELGVVEWRAVSRGLPCWPSAAWTCHLEDPFHVGTESFLAERMECRGWSVESYPRAVKKDLAKGLGGSSNL